MTFKTKLALSYFLTFVTIVVWSLLFFLKWYFIVWLFYFVPLLSRRFIHPFPKVYTNIYKSKLVIACLIVFSIMAIAIAVINVIFANANFFSTRLEKINAYGFITAFVFLIPVLIMTIREEINYAIKTDAEKMIKMETN
jgi:hypothetical protein